MTTGQQKGRVETLGAIPEGSGQKPRVAGSGAANVTEGKQSHWPEALHEPPIRNRTYGGVETRGESLLLPDNILVVTAFSSQPLPCSLLLISSKHLEH